MAYEQKDNSGSLWANEKKEKDTHPDRTGTLMVEGREYWISGWLRKTNDGKPYLSVAVKPKEQKTSQAPSKPQRQQQSDDFSDDVPF